MLYHLSYGPIFMRRIFCQKVKGFDFGKIAVSVSICQAHFFFIKPMKIKLLLVPKRELVEDVGFEPQFQIPDLACYR